MSGEAPNGTGTTAYRGSIPEDTAVPVGIVEAVASLKGCDPMDLEPLGDSVDLESVADLLRSSPSAFRVEFTVAGAAVTVYSDRSLAVVPA
jgi:hypothetical protein